MSSEQAVLNVQWNAAAAAEYVEQQRARPFMLLRPRIFPDGNQWCALHGDNLQEGVCGFGDTPEKAAEDFDKAWRTRVPDDVPSSVRRPCCVRYRRHLGVSAMTERTQEQEARAMAEWLREQGEAGQIAAAMIERQEQEIADRRRGAERASARADQEEIRAQAAEAQVRQLQQEIARRKEELETVHALLDGAGAKLLEAQQALAACERDAATMKGFADLWYFVMDDKPQEFERIVTTYSPKMWMSEASKLRAAMAQHKQEG